MRVSLAAAVAGLAVAIGLAMAPAQALPPGGGVASPQRAETVQDKGQTLQAKDKAKRQPGQRGYKGKGYGFVGSCAWLRGRALTSHNPVWWRKYNQQCKGR
jgi:hypothetical protein